MCSWLPTGPCCVPALLSRALTSFTHLCPCPGAQDRHLRLLGMDSGCPCPCSEPLASLTLEEHLTPTPEEPGSGLCHPEATERDPSSECRGLAPAAAPSTHPAPWAAVGLGSPPGFTPAVSKIRRGTCILCSPGDLFLMKSCGTKALPHDISVTTSATNIGRAWYLPGDQRARATACHQRAGSWGPDQPAGLAWAPLEPHSLPFPCSCSRGHSHGHSRPLINAGAQQPARDDMSSWDARGPGVPSCGCPGHQALPAAPAYSGLWVLENMGYAGRRYLVPQAETPCTAVLLCVTSRSLPSCSSHPRTWQGHPVSPGNVTRLGCEAESLCSPLRLG